MKKVLAVMALVQRDLTADLGDYKITLSRMLIQPAVYILAFGYVMPAFFHLPQGNYSQVVIPGIISIAMMNSVFTTVGGVITNGYYFRTMEGWLLTPLGVRGLMLARLISGLIYGTLSGGIVVVLAWAFLGIAPDAVAVMMVMILLGSLFFSLISMIIFLLPDRPDKGQELYAFLLMPVTFLGCTFYSYSMLVSPMKEIVLFFPTTYISEGLRAAYNPLMPHMRLYLIIPGLLLGIALFGLISDWVFQKRFKDFLW